MWITNGANSNAGVRENLPRAEKIDGTSIGALGLIDAMAAKASALYGIAQGMPWLCDLFAIMNFKIACCV
jgi:hypothetical protein